MLLYLQFDNHDLIFLKLKTPKNCFVLDAACGQGRHAKTLYELGFKVDGFDLSPKNIVAANHYASENLSFFVHDIRDPLPVDGAYEWVCNFFTSFGYFEHEEDDLNTIKAIKADLMHLLLTRKGQRLYNPDFGTDLLKFIFEPEDGMTLDGIKQESRIKE